MPSGHFEIPEPKEYWIRFWSGECINAIQVYKVSSETSTKFGGEGGTPSDWYEIHRGGLTFIVKKEAAFHSITIRDTKIGGDGGTEDFVVNIRPGFWYDVTWNSIKLNGKACVLVESIKETPLGSCESKLDEESSFKGTNFMFVGNPGTGKSTLANSLIGKVEFTAGVAIAAGLTSELKLVEHKGDRYIDTPGLADEYRREAAAKAIADALRSGGKFKVVFVMTLESGRLRIQDLETINIVCDAVKTVPGFHYGVVINKVSEAVEEKLSTDVAGVGSLWLSLKIKPTKYAVVRRYPDCEDKDNVFPSPPPEELVNLLKSLSPVTIPRRLVSELDYDRLKKEVITMGERLTEVEHSLRESIEKRRELAKQLEEARAAGSGSRPECIIL